MMKITSNIDKFDSEAWLKQAIKEKGPSLMAKAYLQKIMEANPDAFTESTIRDFVAENAETVDPATLIGDQTVVSVTADDILHEVEKMVNAGELVATTVPSKSAGKITIFEPATR